MRKNIINITLFASLLTLAGCSNEADIAIPDSAKTPIALSVGVDAPQTRAVITDGTGKTLNAFTSPTDIWMVMQSEYVALSGNNTSPSDIDYKGSKATTNCVTMGTATVPAVSTAENSVSFTSGNIRYWDDAHARSSRLSIWALAVPNKQSAALGTLAPLWSTSGWGSSAATTKDWTISSIQTSATIANEDLCFSNNISKSGETYDKRMKFDKSSDPKAFDQGKLIFYHALTKITIKVVPGEGFKKDGTDFKFDDGSTSVAYDAASVPVALNGFNRAGTFDVKQGEFTSTSTANISKVSRKSYANETGYTLEALVMPGRNLAGDSSTDAIVFSIDKNRFSVSAETLLTKLRAGNAGAEWTTFEAGNNYIFTFTINKTDIELTATIAEWKNVTAEDETPLVNVTYTYGHEGTVNKNPFKFSFLRSLSQASGYDDEADVTYNAEPTPKYTMTPQLYWPNHSTHMFFRGVWPEIVEEGTPSSKVDGTDIDVQNVAYSPNTYPSDLMLGFPRKADGSFDETCKVHSTTQGICATEGEIRMNFQYVMSQVEVNLSTIAGPSAVVFDENTTVVIVGGYTKGSILLSDGSSTLSTKADYTMTKVGDSNVNFHDAIIPQSLGDEDAKLKFRITVKDGSSYDSYETVFGIKDIEVKEGSSPAAKISAWEPGKHYVYNLTITKTGIKVTATIKDWVTATGSTNIWM